MKKLQAGFVTPLLIVIVILIFGGMYLYETNKLSTSTPYLETQNTSTYKYYVAGYIADLKGGYSSASTSIFKKYSSVIFRVQPVNSPITNSGPTVTFTLLKPDGSVLKKTTPLFAYYEPIPGPQGQGTGTPGGWGVSEIFDTTNDNIHLDQKGSYIITASDPSIKSYSFTVVDSNNPLFIDGINGYKVISVDEHNLSNSVGLFVTYQGKRQFTIDIQSFSTSKLATDYFMGFIKYGKYMTISANGQTVAINNGSPAWISGKYVIDVRGSITDAGQLLEDYLKKYPSSLPLQ